MSENMIGTIEIRGNKYIINWPHNQDFTEGAPPFSPDQASATLVDSNENIDRENSFSTNIRPAEGEIFSTEEDVHALAERAILEQLAVNLLVGTHHTRQQYIDSAALVNQMSTEDIEAMLP